jgi:hypothetical protein
MIGPMWEDLVMWAQSYMLGTEPPMANAVDIQIPNCVASFPEAIAILRQAQANWHPECGNGA